MMGTGDIQHRRHRGFTLMELIITIGILTIVMSLLAYPIFSAYGYIRKAQATTDARAAADVAMQRVKQDVSQAIYIFDIAPDGTMLPVIISTNGEVIDTGGNLKLIQYMQVLDLPWGGQTKSDDAPPWKMLYPNYFGQTPSYATYYNPFWYASARKGRANAFILGRYEYQGTTMLPSAFSGTLNGLSPMKEDVYTSLLAKINAATSTADRAKYIDLLRRTFRNTMVSVTPVGDKWDVPQFQATPLRLTTEPLVMLTDAGGAKNATAVVARYPLWAGRNMDVDGLFQWEDTANKSSALKSLYGIDNADADGPESAAAKAFNALYYPGVTEELLWLYRIGSNPFGFHIRIFDNNQASGNSGRLVYGLGKNTNGSDILYMNRHFVDWPPIDRPDWDSAAPLWSKADVARQRLEGKLVFAQPMATKWVIMSVPDASHVAEAELPIPSDRQLDATRGSGWQSDLTYLVDLPNTVTLQQGSGDPVTFRRVASEAEMAEGTFYVPYYGKNSWAPNASSRLVKFQSSQLAAGRWDVNSTGGILKYTICDLQPTDMVVATYATKGVLDIALTVSRQDSTGGTPRQRRQDYTAKFRVIAENAIVKARSSR